MKNAISLPLMCAAIFFAAAPCFEKNAEAQAIVIDPANLAQNIIEVIHLIQSNINEAAMIANQVQSLQNEFNNLQSLNFDIIKDFSSQLQTLFTTLGSIDGLMQHLSDLEAKFDELYPDYTAAPAPATGHELRHGMLEQVRKTREMIRGSIKTSAQVLDGMPQNERQLADLMSNSQSAIGILQAAQAGNQIAGSIAAQLINLNAQLASYIQGDTARLMEENAGSLATRDRLDHALNDWGLPYTPNPVEENPF